MIGRGEPGAPLRLAPWLAMALVLVLTLAGPGAAAQQAGTTGVVALDARVFLEAPPFGRQDRHGAGGSLELERRWRVGANALSLKPHLRVDQTGQYIDLREALWERDIGKLNVRAGFQKVFWGVMESNHLIDIINQTDQASDPDGEEKFGQPMVALGWSVEGLGRFELFHLPYFRERRLPGPRARLRPDPPPAQRGNLNPGGRWHPDFAARWSTSSQLADVGMYVFRGLSREPDLTLLGPDTVAPVLQASYRPITQFGADVQLPSGSMMWKGEMLYRRGHGRPFSAFSVGGEYTWPFAVGDLGLIVEWSRDYRDTTAPMSYFSKALFAGVRYRMNNQHDSEVIVGHQIDRSNHLRFVSVEMSRRLGDNWKLQVEGKKFMLRDATISPLAVLQEESYLQAKLSYFF